MRSRLASLGCFALALVALPWLAVAGRGAALIATAVALVLCALAEATALWESGRLDRGRVGLVVLVVAVLSATALARGIVLRMAAKDSSLPRDA